MYSRWAAFLGIGPLGASGTRSLCFRQPVAMSVSRSEAALALGSLQPDLGPLVDAAAHIFAVPANDAKVTI
jgi:hypothetical protein